MKIGIITFQRAYSYGAKLQAYALSTYLRLNGHQAEVIDYSDIGCGKPRGLDFSGPGVFLRSCVSLARSFHKERVRLEKLQSFFLDDTPHSKRYPTAESLKGIEADYDIFIAGSDQVWCPRYNRGDLNFLLEFVKESKKKYSYAASFGFSKIDSKYIESYKRCLNSFDKILVRENEGAGIVKSLTDKHAEVVLDPTFLLPMSHWSDMAHYPLKKHFGYILCFKILSVSPSYHQLIDHLHRMTGLKIVTIDTAYRYKPIKGKLYSTAGPKEFLGLIKNAKIVVTNSFHATAFSIIFNKDFYTVLNENGLNSRMVNLAGKLGLNGRMIGRNSTLPKLEDIAIDYTSANKLLAEEIEKSKRLLASITN